MSDHSGMDQAGPSPGPASSSRVTGEPLSAESTLRHPVPVSLRTQGVPTHGGTLTYSFQMPKYCIRAATADDLDEARAVMLDTIYRDFGLGFVPRWHGDIIDLEHFYLAPPRHALLIAIDERDGTVAATAALDARGPAHPPNPLWLAERYPSGETAQLRRVYVRPEHRRRGLARRLVTELLAFAKADGGYRSVYLHTYRYSPGAMDLWRSLGDLVCDERDEVPGGVSEVVHFEIPMP